MATYEDIASLLAQERGKAYEQEVGKRLATHEDIENVLKEVQAVTRETETIKAQVGADFWNRQTVWNQRRDLYAESFETILAFRELLLKISSPLIVAPQIFDGLLSTRISNSALAPSKDLISS